MAQAPLAQAPLTISSGPYGLGPFGSRPLWLRPLWPGCFDSGPFGQAPLTPSLSKHFVAKHNCTIFPFFGPLLLLYSSISIISVKLCIFCNIPLKQVFHLLTRISVPLVCPRRFCEVLQPVTILEPLEGPRLTE